MTSPVVRTTPTEELKTYEIPQKRAYTEVPVFPVTILKCTDSSTSGLLKPQSRNTGKESLAEEEEESTYMSPEIHVDSIQTCPESLQVSEPQTTIGMHHSMHKQTAFKGTLTPSSRVLSEESFGLLEGKFKLDFHKIFEDVLEMMEREANVAQPASFDSEYRREVDIGLRCDDEGVLDVIPTGQESYVSDEPMGQINRRRIGRTCDPNPSNHPEVLLESKADMTETYVSELDGDAGDDELCSDEESWMPGIVDLDKVLSRENVVVPSLMDETLEQHRVEVGSIDR